MGQLVQRTESLRMECYWRIYDAGGQQMHHPEQQQPRPGVPDARHSKPCPPGDKYSIRATQVMRQACPSFSSIRLR
jgi:hypothetical protein